MTRCVVHWLFLPDSMSGLLSFESILFVFLMWTVPNVVIYHLINLLFQNLFVTRPIMCNLWELIWQHLKTTNYNKTNSKPSWTKLNLINLIVCLVNQLFVWIRFNWTVHFTLIYFFQIYPIHFLNVFSQLLIFPICLIIILD